jgi:K+-transporting ATPase ATPase C chain
MWLQEHKDAKLERVPADLVMASGSGLDPHITLKNALYQLDRVAGKWSVIARLEPAEVRREIKSLLERSATAPFDGLVGVELINVLEVNFELQHLYRSQGTSEVAK